LLIGPPPRLDCAIPDHEPYAGLHNVAVPATPPLPRARETLLGLARRLGQPAFLRPVLALAGATAALSAAVGFLPVHGAAAGLGPLATGAAVSLLALTAALIQPRAGRAADAGRLPVPAGMATGLALAAVGLLAAAQIPGLAGLLAAAMAVGTGVGLVTPLGFATLSRTAPAGRRGQTMGAAEVGRELGDAGGPVLVAALASIAGLGAGLLGLGSASCSSPAILPPDNRRPEPYPRQPSTAGSTPTQQVVVAGRSVRQWKITGSPPGDRRHRRRGDHAGPPRHHRPAHHPHRRRHAGGPRELGRRAPEPLLVARRRTPRPRQQPLNDTQYPAATERHPIPHTTTRSSA
jgi:hypothetical protein